MKAEYQDIIDGMEARIEYLNELNNKLESELNSIINDMRYIIDRKDEQIKILETRVNELDKEITKKKPKITATIYINPRRQYTFVSAPDDRKKQKLLSEYKSWKSLDITVKVKVKDINNDLSILESVYQHSYESDGESVSSGDIVVVNNKIYMCLSVSWECLGEV